MSSFQKLVLVIAILLIGGCYNKKNIHIQQEYIGQWKSKDSLISISENGKVKYIFEKGGMSGHSVVIKDDKIKFWVLAVPKVFNITKAIDKNAVPMYLELDGVKYIKISDEPKRSLLNMK